MSPKAVIAGGSGFLGQCLSCFWLGKGFEVVVLTRRPKNPVDDNYREVYWDGENLGEWAAELEGAKVLVNLAGKSVDCRYTEANKEAILQSRLRSTEVLGRAMEQCEKAPEVWMNSSSATIYEHTMEEPANDEHSKRIGDDFSMGVCKAWEKCFLSFQLKQTRQIVLRTAIVLGMEGMALQKLLQIARMGLGGAQAGGRQWVSWLHIDDFCRSLDFLLQRKDLDGVFNIAAPNPIRNAEFMRTIRRGARAPFGIPQPAWTLHIGAIFLQTETELLLKSRRVVPGRLQEAGFDFQFPTIDAAIADLTQTPAHA